MGSLEHSGPVWQSERNFQASTASALGLCAASSVARMDPRKRKKENGPASRALSRNQEAQKDLDDASFSFRPTGNPTGQQDRGYGATSALALVVEAVEALALPLRL